jgi:hypothetical protein
MPCQKLMVANRHVAGSAAKRSISAGHLLVDLVTVIDVLDAELTHQGSRRIQREGLPADRGRPASEGYRHRSSSSPVRVVAVGEPGEASWEGLT